MDKIKVRVNAKINLTLDVVGDFGSGYHDLDMVMTSVGIFDVVECQKSEQIKVVMDGKICDEGNTAYKVAKICKEKYNTGAVSINIQKGIPFGGGLGGSSADASATLYCMQKLFDMNDEDIFEIAKTVGSDVNFMLKGGLMRARGKGDDLQNLPFKEYCLLIAKGKKSASTKEVFATFDKVGQNSSNTQKFVQALMDGKNELDFVANGLQKPCTMICPEIESVVKKLQKYSNTVCMSGSGSCVFAVLKNMGDANALEEKLKRKFAFVKACTSLPYGIKEF